MLKIDNEMIKYVGIAIAAILIVVTIWSLGSGITSLFKGESDEAKAGRLSAELKTITNTLDEVTETIKVKEEMDVIADLVVKENEADINKFEHIIEETKAGLEINNLETRETNETTRTIILDEIKVKSNELKPITKKEIIPNKPLIIKSVLVPTIKKVQQTFRLEGVNADKQLAVKLPDKPKEVIVIDKQLSDKVSLATLDMIDKMYSEVMKL